MINIWLKKLINPKEWWFVLMMVFIMIAVTGAPYVFGYLNRGDNLMIGSSYISEADVYVYYSYIEQIKVGHHAVVDVFTEEPQTIKYFNWLWWLIGQSANLTGWSSGLILQAWRLLFIVLTTILLYIFIAYFVRSVAWRRVGLWLVLLSSGWGGFFGGLYYKWWGEARLTANYPMDLWVPEFNPYLSMLYHSPHILASLFFLLLVMLLLIINSDIKSWQLSVITGVIALLFFQFHPYYFPSIVAISGGYLLWIVFKTKNIPYKLAGQMILTGLIALPGFIYNYWLINADSFMVLKSATNITLTPRIDVVIVSYGLVGILAILGVLFRKKISLIQGKHFDWLLVWLLVNMVLLYLPLSIQRRFVEGLYVVMVLWVLVALAVIYNWVQPRLGKITIISLAGFGYILTMVISIVLVNLLIIDNYKTSPELYYIAPGQQKVLKWFSQNVQAEQLVLGNFINSRVLAAYNGQRVYWGHWSETIDGAVKSMNWQAWQTGKRDCSWLRKTGINYIWVTKSDSLVPIRGECLELEYKEDGERIFNVRP